MSVAFLPFLDWIDDPNKGFFVNQVWDFDRGEWIGEGKLQLSPLQRRILGHCLTPDPETGKLPYTTIIYSCPKKSGKTAIAAAVGAWFADECPPNSELFCIANDLEQSEGLVMKDIKFHAVNEGLRALKSEVRYPNGTFMKALAQNYKTIAGSRHALTLWDELWGYQNESSRRAWDEMTPIPTIPYSLRFISTYAGFKAESDLLWELYTRGVGPEEYEDGLGETIPELSDLPCWRNGSLFTYWDHEGRMPWQTEEYYDEQMISLRPAAFLRLHQNLWVTTHEALIPIEWWDYACSFREAPADIDITHPAKDMPIVIGVDAAPKRDCTAVVGVAYDEKEGIVWQAFHHIWTPRSDEVFDFEDTLERYILEMRQKFNIVAMAYDPAHIHQTVVRLSKTGIKMIEYTQTVGNMTLASQSFFDVLKYKKYRAYPDEEAKAHVTLAVAEDKGRGFRIVKTHRNTKSTNKYFIDFTIAAAIGTYNAIQMGDYYGGDDIVIQAPFSDVTAWKENRQEMELPFQFRE